MTQLELKRISWVDYAKFIGIFFVVLGHTSIPSKAINFIYAFHMPLFFFISGYLFNFEKYKGLTNFVKHRFKQLMLPYFYFSIITYVFWILIGRKFGRDAAESISVLTPLIGIFYATDTNNFLIHCGSLWFLPSLFIVELFCFYCYDKLNKTLIIGLLLGAAFLIHRLNMPLMPFSFNTLFIASVFYLLGNMFKLNLEPNLSKSPIFYFILVVSLGVALVFLSNINTRVDMSSNNYDNFPFFILNALIGIFMILSLSKLISFFWEANSLTVLFAKNTLIILAFHEIIQSVIKGVMLLGFKIPIESYQNNLFQNLGLTFLTFVGVIPLIYFIKRFVPFIIGQDFVIRNNK